jgi:hypothetical protein
MLSMIHRLALVSAIVLFTFAVQNPRCLAQIDTAFQQRVLSSNSGSSLGFTADGLSPSLGDDELVQLVKGRGLMALSISKRTGGMMKQPVNFGDFQYLDASRTMGNGVMIALRSDSSTLAFIGPTGEVEERLFPQNVNSADLTENGPVMFRSATASMVSGDAGRTWTVIPRATANVQASPPGTMVVQVGTGAGKPHIIEQRDVRRLRRIALESTTPGSNRVLGESEALASILQRNRSTRLAVAAFDDSVSLTIDSITLDDGQRRAVVPRFIERLNSGALLIADSSGALYRWSKGRGSELQPANVGRPMGYGYPVRGFSYWIGQINDSMIVHQVECSDPPVIRRFTFHIDIAGPARGFYWNRSYTTEYSLGRRGFVIAAEDPSKSGIVDVSGDKPVIYSVGSFMRDIEIFPFQAMLASWRSSDGSRDVVLNDLATILRVDSSGFGFIAHAQSCVAGDEGLPGITIATFENRNLQRWRVWGVPQPVVRSADVLLPGPCIRRFSHDGDFLDTLSKQSSGFVRQLEDSAIYSGWTGVVRRHRGAVTDTMSLPTGAKTDPEVYPSDVIIADDESILVSMLGTDTASISIEDAQPHRRGGVLRSTDNGATFSPVKLPLPYNPYVMSMHRTTDGSLLAVAYHAIEDYSTIEVQSPSTYRIRGGAILRSTDQGQSWSVVYDIPYSGNYRFLSGRFITHGNDGQIFVPWFRGVLVGSADGSTWQDAPDLPFAIEPISIFSHGDRIMISATTGVFSWNPFTTGVNDDVESHPKGALRQQLDLEAAGSLLTRGRYPTDVLGRTVRVHSPEDLAPGMYFWVDDDRTMMYVAP